VGSATRGTVPPVHSLITQDVSIAASIVQYLPQACQDKVKALAGTAHPMKYQYGPKEGRKSSEVYADMI